MTDLARNCNTLPVNSKSEIQRQTDAVPRGTYGD